MHKIFALALALPLMASAAPQKPQTKPDFPESVTRGMSFPLANAALQSHGWKMSQMRPTKAYPVHNAKDFDLSMCSTDKLACVFTFRKGSACQNLSFYGLSTQSMSVTEVTQSCPAKVPPVKRPAPAKH